VEYSVQTQRPHWESVWPWDMPCLWLLCARDFDLLTLYEVSPKANFLQQAHGRNDVFEVLSFIP